MRNIIKSISKKFKKMMGKKKKIEIEGYLLMNDLSNNTFLVLIKENERCWKTAWFSNDKYIHKQTELSISEILKSQTTY
jgi:hypothetical protein